MLSLAEERNRVKLPEVQKAVVFGVRLPEERFLLSGRGWGVDVEETMEGADEGESGDGREGRIAGDQQSGKENGDEQMDEDEDEDGDTFEDVLGKADEDVEKMDEGKDA